MNRTCERREFLKASCLGVAMFAMPEIPFAKERAEVPSIYPRGKPDEVALTVHNALPFERRAEPVRCGVPLVRGFVSDADELVLIGPEGASVPVQTATTGRYRDGTPRWVLLDFLADAPPEGHTVYRLVKGERPPIRQKLITTLEEGVAEIDAGAARFRVRTDDFRLLDSVTVDGQELLDRSRSGGATLVAADESEHQVDGNGTQAMWEETGPLTAVLVVRGEIADGAGLLANYVCRLQFYAGQSFVRVFCTLHNPAAHIHPGNIWDLGLEGSLFIEDFSIRLPLASGRWHSCVGVGGAEPPIRATKLYQNSSGGPNWDSANHIDKDYQVPTRFRGYRAFEGEQQVSEGLRAEGWIHARSDQGGVAASIREFWQNFPKALELEGDALRIGLWPREFAEVHELLGGEQKTHEMLFFFHDAERRDEAVERQMQAAHHPLIAMPDPEALYATRAFWPTAPLDREHFGRLEQTCDTFVYPMGNRQASVITKWEEIDEFGWRHFGDTFADNETSPAQMREDFPEHHVGQRPISHYGNEYDVSYGVLLQGLRRGDPRWAWLADVLCRHYADICIYHTDAEGSDAYRHGPFTHTTHNTAAFRSTHRIYPIETKRYDLQYSSGGPNAGHCYVASLALHYYLTGNRTSREAFLEVADWAIHSSWFTRMMMGDKRGIGCLLMTHVEAYQLTQDVQYYDAAIRMIEYVQEAFEGLGATLFVKAAGRFCDMKLENDECDADYQQALEKMLLFGNLYLALPDDKPKRWLEQTCFYVEVLATCYLHASEAYPNRERYFAKAESLMQDAQSRWSGTYPSTKTLIMCFGNTGAFFRARKLHRDAP